jgi:RimJ/RimL family protein N-acetyltransferase
MRAPLLTDRLLLRDITEADAEMLFDLDSDPEVMRHIGPRPAPDVASYRERTRTVYVPQQAHPWHGVRIVLDRTGGGFLGWVFIRPATGARFARQLGWTRPDEVEVGYRYRRSAWGRGVATEAATPLVRIALADPDTTAVVACALAGNAGSLRVLEKLGLERVGEVLLPETTAPTVKLARVKERGHLPGDPDGTAAYCP